MKGKVELSSDEEGSAVHSRGENVTYYLAWEHMDLSHPSNRYRDEPEQKDYDWGKWGMNVVAGVAVAAGVAVLAASGVGLLVGTGVVSVGGATGAVTAAGAAKATGMAVFLTGSLYVAEQAVSDAVSGRLSETEKYARKALAGSVVGFLTGASGLLMQGSGLGKVLALGFGEGFLGSAATQALLNEDGEINWALAFGEGMFSTAVTGMAWEIGGNVKRIEGGSGTVSRGEYLRNKYGTLTKEELNNRINLRQAVHDELDRLKASGLTKNEIGPMVAGIYDPKMDRYYFGINDLEGYLPSNLHPLLETRFYNMPESILNSYTKTRGAGSHAEIYALNEALWAREKAGIAENLDDLYLNVISATRVSKSIPVSGMPVPRCPHCEYLTEGIYFYLEVLKYGKNSH